jgi:GNAT superfamily N-acetyltransferase
MGFSGKWKKIVQKHVVVKKKQKLLAPHIIYYKVYLTPFEYKEFIGEDAEFETFLAANIDKITRIGGAEVWIQDVEYLRGSPMYDFAINHRLKPSNKVPILNRMHPLVRIGHKKWSGRGIGSAVLDFIVDEYRTQGFKLMCAGVARAKDYSAIPLLEKLGFKALEESRIKGKLKFKRSWVKLL